MCGILDQASVSHNLKNDWLISGSFRKFFWDTLTDSNRIFDSETVMSLLTGQDNGPINVREYMPQDNLKYGEKNMKQFYKLNTFKTLN